MKQRHLGARSARRRSRIQRIADHEGKWIMNTLSQNSRFSIEPLEGRSLMSTVITADFNNDSRPDKVEVTNATTITVSLQNADGSYTVSAILTTPKSQPLGGINVSDVNGDG